MVCQNTTTEDCFKLLAKDGSGDIDFEEFSLLSRGLGLNPTNTKLRAYFDDADKNHNGRLCVEEFHVAFAKLKEEESDGDPRGTLTSVFNKFDRRKQGFLKAEEFRAMMTSMGEPLSEQEIDALFARSDINANEQIDLEGFLRMHDVCLEAQVPVRQVKCDHQETARLVAQITHALAAERNERVASQNQVTALCSHVQALAQGQMQLQRCMLSQQQGQSEALASDFLQDVIAQPRPKVDNLVAAIPFKALIAAHIHTLDPPRDETATDVLHREATGTSDRNETATDVFHREVREHLLETYESGLLTEWLRPDTYEDSGQQNGHQTFLKEDSATVKHVADQQGELEITQIPGLQAANGSAASPEHVNADREHVIHEVGEAFLEAYESGFLEECLRLTGRS